MAMACVEAMTFLPGRRRHKSSLVDINLKRLDTEDSGPCRWETMVTMEPCHFRLAIYKRITVHNFMISYAGELSRRACLSIARSYKNDGSAVCLDTITDWKCSCADR